MKRERRTATRPNIIGAVRTCITPKCSNETPTFYCDECWQQQQVSQQTA